MNPLKICKIEILFILILTVLMVSSCHLAQQKNQIFNPIAVAPADLAGITSNADWLKYNSSLRNVSIKKRKRELKSVEAQLEVSDDNNLKLKFIVATLQVDSDLTKLIKAKAYLNKIFKDRILSEKKERFWELYSENLNKSIRFKKLHALVTRKYKEERTARAMLEGKIRELSEIEQETEQRLE